MKDQTPVAVTSRAFSKNPILRGELSGRCETVKFNDTGEVLSAEELIDFLQVFLRAIVSLEAIDEKILSKTPYLKVISKYGVGLDSLDMAALAKYGVRLGWKAGVNRR